MTQYDDARRGMTARRRTAQSPRGRRMPEIIDGEVVAVEVHDDPRLKVGPVAPDGAELQENLDQVERLAAELRKIAEVMTPASNSGGRPTSAGQARFDQMRAEQRRRNADMGSARTLGQGAADSRRAAHDQGAAQGQGAAHDQDRPPSNRPTGVTRPAWTDAAGEPFAAWAGPMITGRSIVRQPLPPEPKRCADEELIFGTPEADLAADADAKPTVKAEQAASAATAAPTTAATTAAAHPATKASTPSATTAAAPNPKTAAPTTDATPATTTVEMSIAELGVTAPPTANAKTTAPAGRPASEPRRPSGRSDAPRGRYTAIIIGAFVLAVPAFALGVVQPWNASVRTEDKLSVAIGEQNEPPPTDVDPVPVSPSLSPSPSPTPSAAYVPPIAPKTVTAGGADDQKAEVKPPRRMIPRPGLEVSARADDPRPTAGESVKFKLVWKDGSGRFAGSTQQWGDGSPTAGSASIRKCTGDSPATNGVVEATHTFRAAGKYLVRLSVTTYTCDGRTETKTVPVTIVVGPKPSPSPTPTPSPSESPKPGE